MADADLRPMSLGEVLDRTFNLYKNNFWLFVGISALPFSLLFIVEVAVAAMGFAAGRIPGSQRSAVSAGFIGGAAVGALIVGLLYCLMISAAHAATVFAVSDVYLSRPASIRGSFSRVGSKVFRVFLVFFLVLLIISAGFFVVGILAFALRSPAIVGLAILLMIVPVIILICRVAVAIPAAMLEDLGAVRAIERSVHLTKGHVLQIFVIFLLIVTATYVAVLVLQFPLLALMMASTIAHKTPSFGLQVLQQLAAFVSQVLVGPIGTIAFSLMYYNLRVRKEAFDIQHLMASMTSNPEPNAPSVA
jgi:hypothetical protein